MPHSGAQIVPLTTSNAQALPGVRASIFSDGQPALRTATRQGAIQRLPSEIAERNKHLLLVVAVEATHSAKIKMASFEATRSATFGRYIQYARFYKLPAFGHKNKRRNVRMKKTIRSILESRMCSTDEYRLVNRALFHGDWKSIPVEKIKTSQTTFDISAVRHYVTHGYIEAIIVQEIGDIYVIVEGHHQFISEVINKATHIGVVIVRQNNQ